MSSDTPTIDSMNEVIARFMGFEKVYVGFFGCKDGNPEIDETEWQVINDTWCEKVGIENVGWHAVNVKEDKWYGWGDVKYHTSWDWLMPVVIRIKNDESIRLRLPCLNVPDSIWPYMNATKEMNRRLLKADITGTHAGVYKFIQWYNQNKNQ